MRRRFFKCSIAIEPIKNLTQEWEHKRKKRNEQLKAIFDQIPFYNGWNGSESYISGIVCNADNPALEQIKNQKGYKITKLDNHSEGYLIKADKRYKAGKELNKKIEEIYSILMSSPEYSKFMLLNLKLNCWVINGNRAEISVCGVTNENFIVSIPVKEKGLGGDDFPNIPSYLAEIKESEFLAIQGL